MSPRGDDATDFPKLVIGLVGAVGTDLVAIETYIHNKLDILRIKCSVIKISEQMKHITILKDSSQDSVLYDEYHKKMDAGTKLREMTNKGGVLAVIGVATIRNVRKDSTGSSETPRKNHAYLIHSLKHPHKVESLRSIYGDNFALIAGYTPENIRLQNLAARLSESKHMFQNRDSLADAQTLLLKDEAETGKPLGQQVRKTFPLADVFINVTNTNEARKQLGRYIDLL